MTTTIPFVVPQMRRAVAELEAFLDRAHGGGEKILEQACLSKPPLCPRCPGAKAYGLGGGRFGCARCERSFRLFAGRWLDRHDLSAAQWLMALKSFELGLDERATAVWSGVSPATAHRVFLTIRLALVERAAISGMTALPDPNEPLSRSGLSPRFLALHLQEREIRRKLAGRSLFLFLLDAVASYRPASVSLANA